MEYAKSNIDNMLWMVEKFGHMPNGNRTYYLNRSQPPFLSKMVRDVFTVTGDKEWLLNAYKTLVKEYKFWQTDKLAQNGLNSYFGYDVKEDDPENTLPRFCVRCKLDINDLVRYAVFHTHPIESYNLFALEFHNHASVYALIHPEIIQSTEFCNYILHQSNSLMHWITRP